MWMRRRKLVKGGIDDDAREQGERKARCTWRKSARSHRSCCFNAVTESLIHTVKTNLCKHMVVLLVGNEYQPIGFFSSER